MSNSGEKQPGILCLLAVTALTHPGRVRGINEDTVAISGWLRSEPMVTPMQWHFQSCEPLLFALADGMGGHAAGEIASRRILERLSELAGAISDSETAGSALRLVDSEIYQMMLTDPSYIGMGATVVGFVVAGPSLIWFNVGDSRLYRYRNGYLRQISVDDVPAVPSTQLPDERRRSHAVTQSIGGSATSLPLRPHVGSFRLPAESRWLMCSDGVTDMVELDAMEAIMNRPDAEAVSMLFEQAMSSGGEDNISIMIVSIFDTSTERFDSGSRQHGWS